MKIKLKEMPVNVEGLSLTVVEDNKVLADKNCEQYISGIGDEAWEFQDEQLFLLKDTTFLEEDIPANLKKEKTKWKDQTHSMTSNVKKKIIVFVDYWPSEDKNKKKHSDSSTKKAWIAEGVCSLTEMMDAEDVKAYLTEPDLL